MRQAINGIISFPSGAVAQLGERCVRNAEAVSSILIRSTRFFSKNQQFALSRESFFMLPVVADTHLTSLIPINTFARPRIPGPARDALA
jgi:hypothetical protein